MRLQDIRLQAKPVCKQESVGPSTILVRPTTFGQNGLSRSEGGCEFAS